MLNISKEHVMFSLALKRREKHLAQLKEDSFEPSQIKVWENFYSKLLDKNCGSSEVNYYEHHAN